MLGLIDLIATTGVELGRYKLHLATGRADRPLQAYFDGRFEDWQAHQTRRNFGCDSVVGLIQLSGAEWLFVGVWRVLGGPREVHENGRPRFIYRTKELAGLDDLAGRVVVRFGRTFRASYLWGDKYADELEVSRLLPERMTFAEFPGYSSVRISMPELRHIVRHQLPDWRAALSAVAGVYVITDTSNGMLYVGSASGTQGIWGRWSSYAGSLHGSNEELRELLAVAGKMRFEGFQFAVLEICDLKAAEDDVGHRESHWKDVLGTRAFGYNGN